MAIYKLHENLGIQTSGLGGLFNRYEFFLLHASDRRGAYFEWEQDGKVVASVHFSEAEPGLWRSPVRGTYAGLVWAPELTIESLFIFHEAVLNRLRALRVERIEILPAPMAHSVAAFSAQVYVLRACGYEISQCDLNHSLEVDERPLAERMTYGNLKRMRKCAREGLVARCLEHSALPEVYETIASNRASKGYQMSMSLQQLQSMVVHFPEAVKLFGSYIESDLVAAAVCLQVEAGVLYVFYWGDRPGFSTLSPVVSLANSIYIYCQTQGIRLLDVGTSTVDMQPNFGLINFKSGIGFSESLKIRMARKV